MFAFTLESCGGFKKRNAVVLIYRRNVALSWDILNSSLELVPILRSAWLLLACIFDFLSLFIKNNVFSFSLSLPVPISTCIRLPTPVLHVWHFHGNSLWCEIEWIDQEMSHEYAFCPFSLPSLSLNFLSIGIKGKSHFDEMHFKWVTLLKRF